MPRGKTSIYLQGGVMDGEILPNAPTRMLADEMRMFSGSGFTQEANGKIGVFTNAPCLPEKWICYKTHLYRKRTNDPRREELVYEYVEDLMIDRCASLTKAGKRCLNGAEDGTDLCTTHSKMSLSSAVED